MQFREVTIGEYCPTLNYNFKVNSVCNTYLTDILIISFYGNYRDGSAGRPDAGLLHGIIKAGFYVFRPFSLLIDLRDFKYDWGNNLNLSFDEIVHVKTCVVVGDKCRRALSTLMYGEDTDHDIVDNELFFDNFDKAIEKLSSRNQ